MHRGAGDGGFVLHESFKDLKTRRAEQEAYRKALEEQITQRKKLQQEDSDRRRKSQCSAPQPPSPFRDNTYQAGEMKQQNVQSFSLAPVTPPQSSPLISQPQQLSSSTPPLQTSNRSYTPTSPKDKLNTTTPGSGHDVPRVPISGPPQEIPLECVKYMRQVMPSFVVAPPLPLPQQQQVLPEQVVSGRSGRSSNVCSTAVVDHTHAFSSGTSSESSSVEDMAAQQQLQQGNTKMHVSQTSEQMVGVKVSRSQYRVELQKQIDDRKKREDEQRRKEAEEEERIQRKIRLDQEKMQREYEDELKKLQEKEHANEQKRLQAIAMQNEINRAEQEMKKAKESRRKQLSCRTSARKSSRLSETVPATQSGSDESLKSLGEFYDAPCLEKQSSEEYINPDDRIVPVVAKRLLKEREELRRSSQVVPPPTAVLHKNSTGPNDTPSRKVEAPPPFTIRLPPSPKPPDNHLIDEDLVSDMFDFYCPAAPLTDRVRTAFPETPVTHRPGQVSTDALPREMAIRSAPVPSPPSPTPSSSKITPRGLEFIQNLKNYLTEEKLKLEEKIDAKLSRSNEAF